MHFLCFSSSVNSTSDTRYMNFPCTKQVCNTNRRSCNWTQCWHNLPGLCTWSHRMRAQSHKSAPLPLQMQVARPGCHLYFSLIVNQRYIQPPFLDSVNWLELLTELRKKSLPSRLLTCHKNKFRTSQMGGMHKARLVGRDMELSHLSSPGILHPSPTGPHVHQSRNSLNPAAQWYLRRFY